MFSKCSGLTKTPTIAAKVTAQYCFQRMFNECTALTDGGVIRAETLAIKCYMSMFDGCSSLNYVKCMAKDISAEMCVSGWLSGVATTGTFVTPAATGWSSGSSGIPSGWSRVNAE
ncbi:MAG: hypothetical protein J5604_02140 [Bacteroidales bacterium]|nr:hypothetical protein [Bacteroidales bacterium]